ncbi:hypothetical protein V5O48_002996 [Marasmius crinis-equi]|uniref:Uncharacterized protein n=1 Tax=Marasmius crinis-equi TaxID=585013 RepID=A0ABR3FV40_9AGAR
MGRVRPSPAPQALVAALPVVSFEKVEDDLSAPPSGVHDNQARSYGYNDFSDFQRPDHYIRHIGLFIGLCAFFASVDRATEPLEMDLARQVEYDMDEQDKEWLDALNAERKKEHLDKISYETFEIILDRLEKEWFDLTKNIPKPDFAMPSEDSTCAVCDDSEGENANAIVFCDGCNLAVHQDCYGVPYIPEGQWLCRKCTVSPENPPSCVLCPNEGGAFKQTVTGEWCHLLCAIWIPETRVANDVFMEPVTGVEKIPKQRWKLVSTLCTPSFSSLWLASRSAVFAVKEKLLLPMKSTQGSEPVTLTCYCERHLPKEQQEAREKALAVEDSDDDLANPSKLSKSARAYAKSYKPGPPLIPAIIVDRISQYITKINLRKKLEFLHMVCRYWSLKREARRGAPLLKRLHLEPWTATSSAHLQSEEERAMKLEFLRQLQQDLEKAKALVELTRKRELKKRQQAELIRDVLTSSLFPYESKLRFAFENIIQMDRNDYFKNPVNKTEVPDYFEIVKQPMCWSFIDGKLDRHQYWDLDEFKRDIELVLDNAILYNKSGSPYHKTASRIRAALPAHFQGLEELRLAHTQPGRDLAEGIAEGEAPATTSTPLPIGDLEPPLDVIELLVSQEAVTSDLSVILNDDPLTSLFNFELPVDKPPPTPPPVQPKQRKGRNRPTRAEKDAYNAKRREIRAAAKAAASQPGGFSEGGPVGTLLDDAEAISTGSELSANDGPSQLSRGRRTPSGSLPVQPELLDSVDNKGSFRYFNAGWILPPDQKRGGRASLTERPVLPPPRKRARTGPAADDRAASSLSVFSTAEAENETLRDAAATGTGRDPGEHPVPQYVAETAEPDDRAETAEQQALEDEVQLPPESADVSVEHEAMDVDELPNPPINEPLIPPVDEPQLPVAEPTSPPAEEPPEPPKEDPPTDTESALPPKTYTKLANGTIVIEELDSPATRRLKNLKRKSERQKTQQASLGTVQAPEAGPSGVSQPRENAQTLSDLSSLSQIGSEANLKTDVSQDRPQQSMQKPKGRGRGKGKARHVPNVNANADGPEPGLIELKDGKPLSGGTLVWAKSGSYPWWPAVVWEADDPTVPVNIVNLLKKEHKKRKGKTVIHIIQFYDKTSSWQCLPLDKLRMLGESTDLDEDLIAPNSRRQRWRGNGQKQECRDAYRKAKAEMETDADDGEGVEDETQAEDEGDGNADKEEDDAAGEYEDVVADDGDKDIRDSHAEIGIDEGESEIDPEDG